MMSKSTYRPWRIEDISVLDRKRKLNEATVATLMESIKEMGTMLNPITIRFSSVDEDGHVGRSAILVTGLHRLEAANWPRKPAPLGGVLP